MAKLDEYLAEVRSTSSDEFAKTNPHAFLVLYIDEGDDDDEWSFKTTTLSSKRINLARALDDDGISLSRDSRRYRVFSMIKAAGNPWQERISVGRARNNDVVLPHKSVSKLHAHFTNEGKKVLLSDCGSRNGTRINDERLKANKPTSTKPGDVVTFGGVPLTYLDAAGLHDLVTRHIEQK